MKSTIGSARCNDIWIAMALHAAGWRDDGGGILDPVVDALHAAR
ncbi:hypothetical protein [Mycobacterium timonense]|nr:hypothetical protein [Mycobacterium timonense]